MYEKIDLLPEGSVAEAYYNIAKDTIQELNEDIANVCAKWDLGDSYFYGMKLTLIDAGEDWFALGYEEYLSEDTGISLNIMFEEDKTPVITFNCTDDDSIINHHDMCPVGSWLFDMFLTTSLITMNALFDKYLG